MAELLLEIKAAVVATPEPAMRLSLFELTAFEKRYDAVVQAGLRPTRLPCPPPRARRKRAPQTTAPGDPAAPAARLKGQVLAFMADFACRLTTTKGNGISGW